MSRPRRQSEITPDLLLRAYSIGLFPMAEDRDAEHLFWVEPDERGIFPLDELKVSKSLAKTVRSDRFVVSADGDFEASMRACAERDKTWINAEILKLYCELHETGAPIRSKSTWRARWSADSMASASAQRSSARACSIARATRRRWRSFISSRGCRLGGFRLLDAQFLTPHLASLGAIEISRADYRLRLEQALATQGGFLGFSGLQADGRGACARHGAGARRSRRRHEPCNLFRMCFELGFGNSGRSGLKA